MMRWLHLAAVLMAVFVIQADVSGWFTALAIFVFATNLILFLISLDEDLSDV